MESQTSLLPSSMPVPPLEFATLVEFQNHFELNGEYPPGQVVEPKLDEFGLELILWRADTVRVPGFPGGHLETRPVYASQISRSQEGLSRNPPGWIPQEDNSQVT
jgi:hypothetical protein